jgi:hypothetical protein
LFLPIVSCYVETYQMILIPNQIGRDQFDPSSHCEISAILPGVACPVARWVSSAELAIETARAAATIWLR